MYVLIILINESNQFLFSSYLYSIWQLGHGHLFAPIPTPCIVSFDLLDWPSSFNHNCPIDFPIGRKFHTVLPFRHNKAIVFGGAYLNELTNRHSLVDGNMWIFDFVKLEWSKLPSLTMARPTYFHASAINEVIDC